MTTTNTDTNFAQLPLFTASATFNARGQEYRVVEAFDGHIYVHTTGALVLRISDRGQRYREAGSVNNYYHLGSQLRRLATRAINKARGLPYR